MGHRTGPDLNLRATKNHRPADIDAALGVPSHPGHGRYTDDVEQLFDEDFARLLGAQGRVDQAKDFFKYVMQHITAKYHMGPNDFVHESGRILRQGRDDSFIARLAETRKV